MSFQKRRWSVWSGAALLGCCLSVPGQAALIVDLRATSATGSLSLTNNKTLTYDASLGAGSATMQVWAVVTGAAGNSALEGFQNGFGGFRSTNTVSTNGGVVRGTLAATVLTPFLEGSGPTAGSNNDLDGDGDLDVGGTANNNSTGWLFARSNEVITTATAAAQTVTFNPLADGGIEMLLGTLSFNNLSAVPGATVADSTQLNWIGRVDGTTFAAFSFQEDGSPVNALTNQFIGAGSPVTISSVAAIPEPGTVALGGVLLAGLAGWKLRRKKA